jgi:hypothetical protein
MDYGSEVFGFDTELSRDHAWAPQVTLYLESEDLVTLKERLDATFQTELPRTFRGYSTMGTDEFIWHMRATPSASDRHKVRIESLDSFFSTDLFGSPERELSIADWLSIPAQKLRVYTSGKVFHDGLGRLAAIQKRLSWYPHDLWLHIMAVQWERIAEREAFPGRCVHVGDLQGAAWNVAWITRELATLCFLIERHYPVYSKWFGTAFSRLRSACDLLPLFKAIEEATEWPMLEELICAAYTTAAKLHNTLKIAPVVEPEMRPYHQRPYSVLQCGRFADALRSAICSDEVKQLPRGCGAVWQCVDSDILLCDARFLAAYRRSL